MKTTKTIKFGLRGVVCGAMIMAMIAFGWNGTIAATQKAKHLNGKDLLGDNIKRDGEHKLHVNGKHTAFAKVSKGKITGVRVTHADKGDVPVKKYKSTKKMVEAPDSSIQLASLVVQYIGTTYIGYSYIDDFGNEVIYWFPYDMIYDGDTGAVEYIPAS